MDPLSLTASIIAIVGAGGTLMKGLKKLQDLTDAKEDVDDLILELSRLRSILLQIATAFEGTRVTTATSLETMLVEALNTGKTSATDLNTIIQNEVLKIPNKQGTVEVKHIGWMKHKRKIQRLKRILTSVREDVITILTSLTWSAIRRQEDILYQLTLSIEQTYQEQQRFSTAQFESQLHILLVVQGSHRTLELDPINLKYYSSDEAFFDLLLQQNRRCRGFWKYWFSVWRLSHCDFVEVISFAFNCLRILIVLCR